MLYEVITGGGPGAEECDREGTAGGGARGGDGGGRD